MKTKNYQLFFYVPESHLEQVKHALFEAGAGRLGNYSNCCWQTTGLGQYLPHEDAKPFLGKNNQLSIEKEIKVELLCTHSCLNRVIEALIDAHPYEEPAYGVIALYDYDS